MSGEALVARGVNAHRPRTEIDDLQQAADEHDVLGRLCVLPIEEVPPDGLMLSMSVVWQTKSPPGPAGRWFIERLKQTPLAADKMPKTPVARSKRGRAAKA